MIYPETSHVRVRLVGVISVLVASCSVAQPQDSTDQMSAAVVTTTLLESDAEPTTQNVDSTTSLAMPATSSVTEPSSITHPTSPDTGHLCQRLSESEEQPWVVVNDGVMGGRSEGVISTETGEMQFSGTIVTDGGGFSSVRRELDARLAESVGLQLRVRADERKYEVLLTDVDSQAYRVTYYAPLEIEGDNWQVVEVSFDDLEARIFGRRVDAPPFQPEKVTTIGIILADGADGEFLFELDWISACTGANPVEG